MVSNKNRSYGKDFIVHFQWCSGNFFILMLLFKEKYFWQNLYVAGPGVISLESLKRSDALTNEGMKQDFLKTGLYVVGPKEKQM